MADTPPPPLHARVEAALLTAERALSPARLAEATGADDAAIKAAVDELNTQYETTGRSFRIEPVAGGFRMLTLPEHAAVVAALQKTKTQNRLTPSMLETLSVVAYRQPILRAQVEAIRGVACGDVLRSLLDLNVIKITGRAEELGRPMLYGTTTHFLELFGLASLKDLPKVEGLKDPA